MTQSRYRGAGTSSGTYGMFGGGDTGSATNAIDYFTIQTTANAQDFGDLTMSRTSLGAGAGSPS